MKFICFLIVWVAALSIVGCNDEEMKATYPIAVEIVEAAAKDVEEVLEPIIDVELHLPSGTTAHVVDDITIMVSGHEKTRQLE